VREDRRAPWWHLPGRHAHHQMPEGDARPPGVPGLRHRGRRRTAVPCPRDSGRARSRW